MLDTAYDTPSYCIEEGIVMHPFSDLFCRPIVANPSFNPTFTFYSRFSC